LIKTPETFVVVFSTKFAHIYMYLTWRSRDRQYACTWYWQSCDIFRAYIFRMAAVCDRVYII